MRFALICGFLLGPGAMMAQQPSPIMVRSIKIRLISTSNRPLTAIPMDAFAARMQKEGINLSVESKFDPPEVEKAADLLKRMYRDAGQDVRVEYSTSEIRPRGAEVSFEVIQLCTCH
jgi:hypothetical protein